MDIRKLREMIREARGEEAKYARLAEDLELAVKRATNGSVEHEQVKPRLKIKRRLVLKTNPESKSALRTALEVLGEQHEPMHISDLLNEVSKRRGKLTPRASLESVLGTAIKEGKHRLKRTAPGTFEVGK